MKKLIWLISPLLCIGMTLPAGATTYMDSTMRPPRSHSNRPILEAPAQSREFRAPTIWQEKQDNWKPVELRRLESLQARLQARIDAAQQELWSWRRQYRSYRLRITERQRRIAVKIALRRHWRLQQLRRRQLAINEKLSRLLMQRLN